MEFDLRKLSQPLSVPGGNLPLPGKNIVDAQQLRAADRRLQGRHAVIESEFRMVIPSLRLHGVTAQEAETVRQLSIVSNDHSTFACRDHFIGVERKSSSQAKGSRLAAIAAGATCFGCIFDQHKVGDRLSDGLAICGIAIQVDNEHRLRAPSFKPQYFLWSNVPVATRYVGKNRSSAGSSNGCR